MWQRFTERARRVILLAQEEAGNMRSSHVGTEHLLLGLVREDEGVAAQVLQKMGVRLHVVRAEVQSQAEPGTDASPEFEPKLTPMAKRVLELAADEARRMKHSYIGTEHLLLALLRERDGLAAKALGTLGLDLEMARAQVLDYLGAEDPAASSSRMRYKADLASLVSLGEEERREGNDFTLASMMAVWLVTDSAPLAILVESGLDIEAARRKLKQFLEENSK